VRCLSAVDAKRPREAAALGVQMAIQAEREGRSWNDLPQPILVAISYCGWDALARAFAAAIDHLKHYRFGECRAALRRLPHDLEPCLAAEADYLHAMCCMSTRNEDDRAEGRAILEEWDAYVADEPELGMRLLQLQLYGLTHLVDKRPGGELRGRIRGLLRKRVSFDVAAEDALYTLDRCSGSLDDPDLAVDCTREAVRHFGPESGQTVLRRPVEYYRCLVNYGANLIGNARYEEARDVYAELERLVDEHADGMFPRLDHPRMNALLAEYRLGAVGAPEAVERQREIVETLGVANDPFYVNNALGVYLALADRHDEAREIFNRLGGEIERRRTLEPSMAYLIRANRCATRFVAGRPTHHEWSALDETVQQIAYVIRRFLVKRHALLGEVIERGERMSARAFDECLVAGRPPEFGPFWANYGRGFRMPEVEFWREN
jgi:tetratricopeptide (TPR) repeat protein